MKLKAALLAVVLLVGSAWAQSPFQIFLRSLDTLTLIRAHIASGRILRVGARFAALIGFQQMAEAIGAAIRVSGVNRGAAGEQRNGWRRPAVVPQRAQHGVGVVPVAGLVESAGAAAAQVIAMRGDGAATTRARIVRDNAVLQRRCAAVSQQNFR